MAIIGGLVALFLLLVVLAVGLEAVKSANTLAILGVFGTGLGAIVVGQIVQINKTNAATQIAAKAAETADDTNARTQNIEHALNGAFELRVTDIVGRVFDDRFRAFETTLDSRIRAGVASVQAEREDHFDNRMRGLIATELERRDVACKPNPSRRSRR